MINYMAEINEDNIRKYVNNIVDEVVQEYIKLGKTVHKEIRERSTIKWFSNLVSK